MFNRFGEVCLNLRDCKVSTDLFKTLGKVCKAGEASSSSSAFHIPHIRFQLTNPNPILLHTQITKRTNLRGKDNSSIQSSRLCIQAHSKPLSTPACLAALPVIHPSMASRPIVIQPIPAASKPSKPTHFYLTVQLHAIPHQEPKRNEKDSTMSKPLLLPSCISPSLMHKITTTSPLIAIIVYMQAVCLPLHCLSLPFT